MIKRYNYENKTFTNCKNKFKNRFNVCLMIRYDDVKQNSTSLLNILNESVK